MKQDFISQLCTENIQPRPRRGGWHGGPTPLGALRGVTAELAAWKPARDRKSIWDLSLHIAYWKYAVRRRLQRSGGLSGDADRFPVSPSNWPLAPPSADDRLWAEHVAILRAEHEKLVAAVASIPAAQYRKVLPGRRRWTVGELILGIAQHDAYHTGQIQMLKRLGVARARRKLTASRTR